MIKSFSQSHSEIPKGQPIRVRTASRTVNTSTILVAHSTRSLDGCQAGVTKTLSENFPVSLEQRRISPRMGLPPSPFSKGDAPYGRGYHNAENGLLPDAEAIVEETQEIPAQAKEESKRERRQAQSLREGSRRRHLVCALDRMPMEGSPSRLVWGLLKRRPRAFPEVERGRHIREA